MRIATAVLALVLAAPAWATVPDNFGFGARSMGSGGGGVAMVEDGNAAYVNPGGLSRIRRPFATLGFNGAIEWFDPVPPVYWDTNQDGVLDELDEPLQVDVGVDDALGFNLSAGRQIGGKFGLGITVYVPINTLMRFGTFEPELPHYFMYDHRHQRYVMAAGIGGEIVRGVNIGASVSMVPKVRYNVFLTIDGTITGDGASSGELEDALGEIEIDVHEMELDVVPDFAPIVGIQLEIGRWIRALDGLVIAAAYRGSVGLPIDVNLDIQANLTVEDVGDLEPYVVAVVLRSGLQLFDHYVPMQLSFGAAYRTDDTLSAYVDVKWTDWRRMNVNIARVKTDETSIDSPLIDVDEKITDGNEFGLVLRSVWSVRMGTELRLPRIVLRNAFEYARITLRGGFGYEPTPLVSQGDGSAFLDTNRVMFTAGAGIEHHDPFKLTNAPVHFDGYVQYHVLARGRLPHASNGPAEGYPVGDDGFPIGGSILAFGAQFGFEY